MSYALTSPRVAELLTVARAILTGVVAGQAELLEDLPAVIGEATGPRAYNSRGNSARLLLA